MTQEPKPHQYERGTLIGFERGEYSDFRFDSMLVALTRIDLPALARAFVEERKANPDPDDWSGPENPHGFTGWLVAKQYAAPIDYSTVHLGTYGSFDDDLYQDEDDD